MTGSYTGWLLKQAKGRALWANRSDIGIALTGSIEMLICGGLPLLLLWLIDWRQPAFYVNAAIFSVLMLVYWFGFKHIRHGLREAQMEPLL